MAFAAIDRRAEGIIGLAMTGGLGASGVSRGRLIASTGAIVESSQPGPGRAVSMTAQSPRMPRSRR